MLKCMLVALMSASCNAHASHAVLHACIAYPHTSSGWYGLMVVCVECGCMLYHGACMSQIVALTDAMRQNWLSRRNAFRQCMEPMHPVSRCVNGACYVVSCHMQKRANCMCAPYPKMCTPSAGQHLLESMQSDVLVLGLWLSL